MNEIPTPIPEGVSNASKGDTVQGELHQLRDGTSVANFIPTNDRQLMLAYALTQHGVPVLSDADFIRAINLIFNPPN